MFPHRYYNLNLDSHYSCKIWKGFLNPPFKKQCCENFGKERNSHTHAQELKMTIYPKPTDNH